MLTFLKGLPLAAKIGVPIVAALLVWIAVLQVQLSREQTLRDRISFHADSVIASKDTTHLVDLSELSKRELEKLKLGDSLQVVQRLMVQAIGKNDVLERALGLERRARLSLTAQLDSLRLVVVSPGPVVETPEGVRSATFQVDSVPFSGTVSVALPRPPAVGSLNLAIGVVPAVFALRVSCGTAPPGSTVRPAVVTTTGPNWLTMTLGRLEQDPATCNQGTLDSGSRRGHRLGLGCSVGPGLMAVDKVVRTSFLSGTCGVSYLFIR